MAGMAAHVTNRDIRAAQAILDALAESLPDTIGHLEPGPFGHARGQLATWAADLREAGYDEGIQVGRRQTAHLVRDALTGEGL